MSFALSFVPFPPPDGPLSWALVPWDTALFGISVYELRLSGSDPTAVNDPLKRWLASIPADQARLICAKLPAGDVAQTQILTRQGFYPVETSLEIALPMARMTPIALRRPASLALRPAGASDLRAIGTVARSAFIADRFHLDPNLPPNPADQRYVEWVERGFREGEPVFVWEDMRNGRTLGFYHIRPTASTVVDLSLAAVDPVYRQSGLGSLMYQAVLEKCYALGFEIAETRISVNNLDVLNLFFRLGFTVRRALNVLHWYAPPA